MIGHVVAGLSVAKEPSRHFRGLQLPPNGGRDQLKDAPRRRDERWPCGSVPTRQGGPHQAAYVLVLQGESKAACCRRTPNAFCHDLGGTVVKPDFRGL